MAQRQLKFMRMPKYEPRAIVHLLLDTASPQVKDELKQLLSRKASLNLEINQQTTLGDLEGNPNAIWSILFRYGVLNFEKIEGSSGVCRVFITNDSVREFLIEKFVNWALHDRAASIRNNPAPESAEQKSRALLEEKPGELKFNVSEALSAPSSPATFTKEIPLAPEQKSSSSEDIFPIPKQESSARSLVKYLGMFSVAAVVVGAILNESIRPKI